MKIRFIQTFSNDRRVFAAHKDYEVPNDEAIRYIDAGVARKSVEGVHGETPDPAPEVVTTPPLKPGEKVGKDADKTLPEAEPLKRSAARSSNNPAAFARTDAAGNVVTEPHTGFTTTNPDGTTSPASDGKSPLASNVAPEAVGNASVGQPTGTATKAK